jgi:predicted DNA-binding transcriptional regulator YafY
MGAALLVVSLFAFAIFCIKNAISFWKEAQSPEFQEKLMAEKIKKLTEAIQLKEWIKISYGGGSQPWAVREVLPLRISKDQKHLYATNDASDKEGACFQMDKVYLESPEAEVDYKDPSDRKRSRKHEEDEDEAC